MMAVLSPLHGIVRPMLAPSDATLLRLWSMSWNFPAHRNQRVLDATGLHPTQAAQRVNMLIDTQAALEALPVEVNRLRRIRAQGQRSRRVEA